MSETNWGESGAPAPKKRIPTWLWFCGGGCLLALVLAIAGGAFLFMKGKEMIEEGTNAELQWKRLEEVLPYDHRPEMATLRFGGRMLGQEGYWFDDSDGYMVILMVISENDPKKRERALDPNEAGGAFGRGQRRNMQPVTLHVQGRDLKGLRFEQMGDDEERAPDGAPRAGKGPAMLLDVTPQSSSRFLLLEFIRLNDTQQVKDEDVLRFLAPFHVGPDR